MGQGICPMCIPPPPIKSVTVYMISRAVVSGANSLNLFELTVYLSNICLVSTFLFNIFICIDY